MDSFQLDFHTKMFFGLGSKDQVGTVLKEAGFKKVMIVCDDIAIKLELLDKIKKLIDDAGIENITMSGIRANPDLSIVKEGIKKCLDNDIECVVAIGGGSVIDSCKAIIVGAGNPGIDIWDCYEGVVPAPRTALKMAVISTTAATGSETNASSVLSNDVTHEKRSFFCDASRATYAFMDPSLLYTLPRFQRSCTVVDIFAHTHERYCAQHGENKIADECSEGNMRVLLEVGPTFIEKADDYQAASEIMFAGTHAFLTCGTGGAFDWSTHNLAHEISGHYPQYTHAATITTMWPVWAKYVCKDNAARFAQLGRKVFGIQEDDNEKAADMAIDATIDFFKQCEMPTSIKELMGRNLTQEEIDSLVESCTYHGKRESIGALKNLYKEDMKNIFTMANT